MEGEKGCVFYAGSERRLVIILLGSTGYVGQHFARTLDLFGMPWRAVRSTQVNLSDSEAVLRAIRDLNPTFLINCAGFTGKPNVDACEWQKTECLMGNAIVPGAIAKACDTLGVTWGHVSSGCIFTGRRSDGHGFTEVDSPNFSFRQNNCSFYSGAKALGEEVVAEVSNCYIWRLRIPFNEFSNPRNYLQKLMSYEKLIEAENSLSNLDEFVTACIDSYRNKIPFGVYNLTNPGSVWTSQVCELISQSGVCKKLFQFFDNEKDFMTRVAKTPRSHCVLDSTKAVRAGLSLSPTIAIVERCLATWKGKT